MLQFKMSNEDDYQNIKIDNFPNGESTVHMSSKFMENYENVDIYLKFENDLDLMTLFKVLEMCAHYEKSVRIMIPYMPYERSDRFESDEPSNSQLLRRLFDSFSESTDCIPEISVFCLEPHNLENYTEGLLSSRLSLYHSMFNDLDSLNSNCVYVFPDKGAVKRYLNENYVQSADLKRRIQNNEVKILVGEKHRNFDTGQILSYKVTHEIEIKDAEEPDFYKNGDEIHISPIANTLITDYIQSLPSNQEGKKTVKVIDDLCSRGGTFCLLADEIVKQTGLDNISFELSVAHAEKGILEGSVFSKYDHVYTTDSIISNEDIPNFLKSRITIYSALEMIEFLDD